MYSIKSWRSASGPSAAQYGGSRPLQTLLSERNSGRVGYTTTIDIASTVAQPQGTDQHPRGYPGTAHENAQLAEQLEQEATPPGTPFEAALVDLGCRGRKVDGIRILHRRKPERMSRAEKRLFKRRQAVEPVIRHLKADRRMRRNFRKGALTDVLNPIL